MVLTHWWQLHEKFGLFSSLSSLTLQWDNSCISDTFTSLMVHLAGQQPPGPWETYILATSRCKRAGGILSSPIFLLPSQAAPVRPSPVKFFKKEAGSIFFLLTHTSKPQDTGVPELRGHIISVHLLGQVPSSTSCGHPQFLRLVFLENPQPG